MRYFRIIKINTNESTNLVLKERSASGKCNDGDVIWSLAQVKGRGQRNAQWLSEPGKNLTFSLYKEYRHTKINNPFLINCIVSLAVKSTLEFFNIPEVFVKWPNDILSGDKKICGILIENVIKSNTINSSIIGVGINVNQMQFENLPEASSMQLILEKPFVIEEVLNCFLNHFSEKMKLLKLSEQDIISLYEKNLYRFKEISTFETKKGVFAGTIEGVTTQGLLKVLNEDNQLETFDLKEIRLKR